MSSFKTRIFKASELWQQLPKSAAKKADGPLPYTRYVNRPLANYVVIAAYVLRVTPNQLSSTSFLLSIAAMGGLLFSAPGSWSTFFSVAVLLIAYILDSADGRLSRVTKAASAYGEWLDHSYDAIKLTALTCTFAALIWRTNLLHPTALFAVASIALIGTVGQFFSTMLREQLQRNSKRSEPVKSSTRNGILKDVFLFPLDYGIYCFLPLLQIFPRTFVFCFFAVSVIGLFRLAGAFLKTKTVLQVSTEP